MATHYSYQVTTDAAGNRTVTENNSNEAFPQSHVEPQRQSLANKGGAVRVTVGGPQGSYMEDLGNYRYNPSQDDNGLPSFLSTGKTPGGLPIYHEGDIKDNTMFNINGMEVPASSAAKAGLLNRHNDGTYSLNPRYAPTPRSYAPTQAHTQVTQAHQVAPQVPTQVTQEVESEVVDYQSYNAQSAILDMNAVTGSQQRTDALVGQSLRHLLEGNTEAAAAIHSRSTGVDPSLALEQIQGVYDEVYASAAGHIERTYGVSGEAVFDYLSEALSPSQRTSLSLRIYHGDRSAFQEAVTLYKRSNRA